MFIIQYIYIYCIFQSKTLYTYLYNSNDNIYSNNICKLCCIENNRRYLYSTTKYNIQIIYRKHHTHKIPFFFSPINYFVVMRVVEPLLY